MADLVKLRNGSEEAPEMVKATMLHLAALDRDDPVSLSQLLFRCQKGKSFPFLPSAKDKLIELGLLSTDGKSVHESVKNIVLSALEADGPFVTLVDPVVPS